MLFPDIYPSSTVVPVAVTKTETVDQKFEQYDELPLSFRGLLHRPIEFIRMACAEYMQTSWDRSLSEPETPLDQFNGRALQTLHEEIVTACREDCLGSRHEPLRRFLDQPGIMENLESLIEKISQARLGGAPIRIRAGHANTVEQIIQAMRDALKQGKDIHDLFAKTGLKQRLIAERMGVDRSSVSRLINHGCPGVMEWVQVEKFLEVVSILLIAKIQRVNDSR